MADPSNAMSQRRTTQVVRCARDANGVLWMVCVARRTYSFASGSARLADEQDPIVFDPDIETDAHGRYRALREDMDLAPPKEATDVIVKAHAHAPSPVRELLVSAAVGKNARALRATGERRVEVSIEGKARFPDPAPFESVPLTWDRAYGGYDAYAHDELVPPERRGGRRIEPSPRDEGVMAYPRNKIGRAYFIDVDRDRADGALLPQVEDPGDLLTPSRLFLGRAQAWLDAPMPACLDWMPHTFYPRIMRGMGAFLEHDPPATPIRERSFADGADLGGPFVKNKVLPRFAQGAAPGMACERLRGDEHVVLGHLVRGKPDVRFALPGERPSFTVRPPGSPKAFTPEPVLQTVRIDGEAETASLVWCGAVRLLAALTEEQAAETALAVAWK